MCFLSVAPSNATQGSVIRRGGGGDRGAQSAWVARARRTQRSACGTILAAFVVRRPGPMEDLLKRLRRHRTLWILGVGSLAVTVWKLMQRYRIKSPHHRVPLLVHYDYVIVGSGASGSVVRPAHLAPRSLAGTPLAS